ncbi:hypothetical protein TrLO_g12838 [Triparma laevis f. longispina]|uniref:Uncharacterized protein n=1 Tax=Triparma laevis f. longispina TaxID=1714387 RepID=A0A9W7KYF8_9STRA|nr:hypothetical protein TrLO_g12838 [Triparma laevis f. longispina]
MHTPEFRRHFVEYVPIDTLVALRLATKPWMREIENLLRRIVANGGQRGKLLVHDGNDTIWDVASAREDRRQDITQVIFLLNIMKVGQFACIYA